MCFRRYRPAAFALAALLCLVGCGTNDESTADPGQETEIDLQVEQDISLLAPSEVRIGAVGAGGGEEGREAARSETRRIDRILSDLDAERVEGDIRINLPEAVLFDFDEAELREQAIPTLAQLSELAEHFAESPIRVEGHTDSRGAAEYNQQLSERRAEAVRDHLVQRLDVAEDRIRVRGFGETRPVAPNERPDGSDDPEGRERNRRVEVIIEDS